MYIYNIKYLYYISYNILYKEADQKKSSIFKLDKSFRNESKHAILNNDIT